MATAKQKRAKVAGKRASAKKQKKAGGAAAANRISERRRGLINKIAAARGEPRVPKTGKRRGGAGVTG